MALAESAVRVWRAHHEGGLTFEMTVKDGRLVLPWTGRRIEMTNDLEEMRGRLREVGFNEEAVEELMTWLFRGTVAAETPVTFPKLVESFV